MSGFRPVASPAPTSLSAYSTTTQANALYATVTGGGVETVSTVAATGSTETLDLANGNVHDITLDANCTLTLTGSTASKACSMTIIVRQDGTGSRTLTWPASVKWPGSTAPTLSTGASKVDVITLVTVDNGTTWLGFTAGLDLR